MASAAAPSDEQENWKPLAAGSRASFVQQWGEALFNAVVDNDVERVQILVNEIQEDDCNVDCVDESGFTPLLVALASGNSVDR